LIWRRISGVAFGTQADVVYAYQAMADKMNVEKLRMENKKPR